MVRKNAKTLIENAFVELLRTESLERIDIQNIAEAAGLSRQTFYYNFKNKQDLLCWILDKDTNGAYDMYLGSGILADYICTFLHIVESKSVFYRSIAANDARRRSYIAYFENGIINCAQQAESHSPLGRMDAQEWDALRFFAYGASGMLQNWVENGMQQTPEQVTEIIIRNLPEKVGRYFQN